MDGGDDGGRGETRRACWVFVGEGVNEGMGMGGCMAWSKFDAADCDGDRRGTVVAALTLGLRGVGGASMCAVMSRSTMPGFSDRKLRCVFANATASFAGPFAFATAFAAGTFAFDFDTPFVRAMAFLGFAFCLVLRVPLLFGAA